MDIRTKRTGPTVCRPWALLRRNEGSLHVVVFGFFFLLAFLWWWMTIFSALPSLEYTVTCSPFFRLDREPGFSSFFPFFLCSISTLVCLPTWNFSSFSLPVLAVLPFFLWCFSLSSILPESLSLSRWTNSITP